ncbi:unnamed protein product [Staurois parvus]|nr:unnamed protein product [Staurois parvus]
MRRIRL